MIEFIQHYWTEVVFGLITAAVAAGYRSLKKDLEAKILEQKAVKTAVTALLRQTLYDVYNKWSEKGYCPIYAMEICAKVYEQYHALGGNNIGTELYERLRELPTQPIENFEQEEN